VVPTRPLWLTLSSHSPARVESPGSGKLCVNVHRSTSRKSDAAVLRTCVVTVVSRCVVQKLGAALVQVEEPQFRSNGVSGKCAASWVPHPDRHRSA
jgi:hypothetical protein